MGRSSLSPSSPSRPSTFSPPSSDAPASLSLSSPPVLSIPPSPRSLFSAFPPSSVTLPPSLHHVPSRPSPPPGAGLHPGCSPCEDRQRHLQVRAGTAARSPTPGRRGSFSASWRSHGGARPPGPVPVPPSAARSLGSGCSGSTLASIPAPPLSPLTTLITRQALLPKDQTPGLILEAEFLPLSQPA